MSDAARCPQCGAGMEVKLIGELRDKHLSCTHCGCLIDVPDEYEVSHREESVGKDGSKKRVEVSHRRVDLGGAGKGAAALPEEDPKEILSRMRKEGAAGGAANVVYTTNSVTESTSQTTNLLGAGELKEIVTSGQVAFFTSDKERDEFLKSVPPEMRGSIRTQVLPEGMPLPLDRMNPAMREMLEKALKSGPEAGKTHVVTTKVVEEFKPFEPKVGFTVSGNPPAAPGDSGPLQMVKWLTLLAAIILAIVLILKLGN